MSRVSATETPFLSSTAAISASAADIAPRRRSLAPREHGAYGQLLFPLLTAFGVASWSWAGLALTGATVALFLAHEPGLVMLGHRGRRVQRVDGDRAWRVLLALLAAAGILGGTGVALAPSEAQIAIVVPALLAVVVGLLMFRKQEKTTGGELMAASALSSVALPIMLANGASLPVAFAVVAVWVTVFAVATLAVRGVIATQKSRACAGTWLGMGAASILGVAAVSSAASLAASLILIPAVLVGLSLFLLRPSARRLRGIGWSIMGTCAVTTGLLIGFVH